MRDELRAGLRESYDRKARERNLRPVQLWKAEERLRFLAMLQSEGARTLLELGAGPGKDGEFFRDHGLDVVCTDLSPEMIELCESKGLAARVMDLSDLDFLSDAFDAVYALNCLLHLPGRELPAALRGIRTVLKPGGLFYLGVYGGRTTRACGRTTLTSRSGSSPSTLTSDSRRWSPGRSTSVPSGGPRSQPSRLKGSTSSA